VEVLRVVLVEVLQVAGQAPLLAVLVLG